MRNLSIHRLRFLFLLLSCLPFGSAMATHLVGDDFTYKYLGDTSISGTIKHKYEIRLDLYEDCLNGAPSAILEDNPAFFGIYNSTSLFLFDSVTFSSSITMPAYCLGPCGSGLVPLCVLKKTFTKIYFLPSNFYGYTVVYQRCCKNAALINVVSPVDAGSTYFIKIPPTSLAATNNSAVFSDYPPLEIAKDYSFAFDHSATDADGDSLSYELCNAFNGITTDIKPFPLPPPYTAVDYIPPFSYSNPMSCSVGLAIDPLTGLLTGTPNALGRYLITICCNEWRGGVIINTIKREFEFTVVNLAGSYYHPFAGNDTSIYVGDSIQFNATGASSYSWVPSTYLTNNAISNPVGHYPAPGIFTYILHGVSDTGGCLGNDTITVNVVEASEYKAPGAFTPNGDGLNDYFRPIAVKNATLISMKVYDTKWRLIHASDVQDPKWDGNYNGVKMDAGSYNYELIFKDNKGNIRSKTGTVILIR